MNVDGLPTTVVSFTTDVPMFGRSWGEPLLLGPGSIHVAHTSEERIAKKDLSDAVEIYATVVKNLLAAAENGVAVERKGLKMNLAIVGYGKMGRLIEQLAPEYGFDVKLRLDVNNNARFEGLTAENFRGIDAAIEFSTPATAPENIERLARLGVNTVVVGTTGWFEQMERARDGRGARQDWPGLESRTSLWA